MDKQKPPQITWLLSEGGKDRVVTLASELIVYIQRHLETVRTVHERDLLQGHGEVYRPYALARKYPNASCERCVNTASQVERRVRGPLTHY